MPSSLNITKKEGQINKLDGLLSKADVEIRDLRKMNEELQKDNLHLASEKSSLVFKLKEAEESEFDRRIAAREREFERVLK